MSSSSSMAKLVWVRNVEEEQARRRLGQAAASLQEGHASVRRLQEEDHARPVPASADLAVVGEGAAASLALKLAAAREKLAQASKILDEARAKHAASAQRLKVMETVLSNTLAKETQDARHAEQRVMDDIALMLRARR